jgi:tRNA A-37 threonylcarbamoyl transferase component Bud32
MDSVIGTTLGPYRLIERIGRGGMANVYVAETIGGHARVAIKVLTALVSENDQFVQRFRQEARVVAKLSHPNIIPVIDYGEVDGKAYLVMPYHPLGSLSDLLARGSIPPEQGGRIVAQVSSALQFAHEQGVIHRDVKPSNVLLDDQGNAWLSDFGLAYMHDASLSLTGSAMLGTPAYVSPEQARGIKASARSDQYSLGIVLFEMATGQLPFDAETPMGVLVKHMQTPIPLPRSIRGTVPVHIERVILKATAKDPEDRFGSVAEMNAAFQAALAHALHPSLYAAPALIAVPPSHPTIPLPDSRYIHVGRRRIRPWQLGVAATLLALFVCLPSAYAGMYLLPATTAAGAPQLTAQAATIEALSAQLQANQAGLSDDEVQAAVMQTMTVLQASGDGRSGESLSFGQPGGLLPGVLPVLFGGATPTNGSPNGGSPAPNSFGAAPTRTPNGSGGYVYATNTYGPSPTGGVPTVTQVGATTAPSAPAPSATSGPPPATSTSAPPPTAPPPTSPPPTAPPPTNPPPPTDPPPTEVKICKDKPHPVFPTCEPG